MSDREIIYLQKEKNSGNKYRVELPFNEREKTVALDYASRGYVVLKNGWPDLLCYNPGDEA